MSPSLRRASLSAAASLLAIPSLKVRQADEEKDSLSLRSARWRTARRPSRKPMMCALILEGLGTVLADRRCRNIVQRRWREGLPNRTICPRVYFPPAESVSKIVFVQKRRIAGGYRLALELCRSSSRDSPIGERRDHEREVAARYGVAMSGNSVAHFQSGLRCPVVDNVQSCKPCRPVRRAQQRHA